MGRAQETFNKKDVRNKKEKKRKEKEKKRLERKENGRNGNFDDMLAYVDENGMITSTPPDPNKKKKEIKLKDIEVSVSKKKDEVYDPIRIGTVSYFNESKGYGFIRDIETKESIFVHINNLIDNVTVGNKVCFEIENGPRGLAAKNVKISK